MKISVLSRRNALWTLATLVAFGTYAKIAGLSLDAILSGLGSIASLVGVAVALVQLHSIKQTSEATEKAVRDTHQALINTLTVSDVSKALRLVEEVQAYAGESKHESARLRLQDLHHLLIQFKNDDDLQCLIDQEKYAHLLTTVGIDLHNLYNSRRPTQASLGANHCEPIGLA
jgi:hypothetical protein